MLSVAITAEVFVAETGTSELCACSAQIPMEACPSSETERILRVVMAGAVRRELKNKRKHRR